MSYSLVSLGMKVIRGFTSTTGRPLAAFTTCEGVFQNYNQREHHFVGRSHFSANIQNILHTSSMELLKALLRHDEVEYSLRSRGA